MGSCIKSLRDGPLEITEGGGGGGGLRVKNFRCMNFFKPTCLHDFFSQAQALHEPFFHTFHHDIMSKRITYYSLPLGSFLPCVCSVIKHRWLTLIRTWRINYIPPFCRNQKDYYPEYPDILKHGIKGQLPYYNKKEYLPFLNIMYIFCYFVDRYCFGNNNVSFWWKFPLRNWARIWARISIVFNKTKAVAPQ